ncbi:MAG: YoaK family protein [Brevundimonas sp.]
MQTLGPVERWMAVLLAALAGYVDSIGFLQLGGLFVSFMSGNTTRMAAGLAQGDWRLAGTAGLILLLFVAGAMLGALVAAGAGPRSRSRVLTAEAVLLLAAALAAGLQRPMAAVACMVIAMGLENAVFLRNGQVGVGLTYMTGALVRIGHTLAAALRGGALRDVIPPLLLWGGLTSGAILGALSFNVGGLVALYPAAGLAAALALAAGRARAT